MHMRATMMTPMTMMRTMMQATTLTATTIIIVSAHTSVHAGDLLGTRCILHVRQKSHVHCVLLTFEIVSSDRYNHRETTIAQLLQSERASLCYTVLHRAKS